MNRNYFERGREACRSRRGATRQRFSTSMWCIGDFIRGPIGADIRSPVNRIVAPCPGSTCCTSLSRKAAASSTAEGRTHGKGFDDARVVERCKAKGARAGVVYLRSIIASFSWIASNETLVDEKGFTAACSINRAGCSWPRAASSGYVGCRGQRRLLPLDLCSPAPWPGCGTGTFTATTVTPSCRDETASSDTTPRRDHQCHGLELCVARPCP